MPARYGRIFPRLQDHRASAEIDRLYDVIQNLRVSGDNLDPPSVAAAVGAAIKDGQLEVLNRFLRAGSPAKAIYIIQDEPLPKNNVEARALAVSRSIPSAVLEAVYFGHDAATIPTLKVQNTAAGPCAHFDRTGTGGSVTADNNCCVRVDQPANARGLLVRKTGTGLGVPLFILNNGTDDSIQATTGAGTAKLTNGGAWQPVSTRRAKEDFQKPDRESFIQKLKKLKIWNYRYKKAKKERHVGPTAEDFHAAFEVSDNDGTSGNDLASVGLVAIQWLIDRVESLEKRVAQLEAK